MTTRGNLLALALRWSRAGAIAIGFSIGVIVLLLWLAGKFSAKVPAGSAGGEQSPPQIQGEIVAARMIPVEQTEAAVGTIRAVHETTIASKLLARVVEVNLKAGQKVREGDVLVRLDDSDLQAKLQQANAAVRSLDAAYAQALVDQQRYSDLFKSNAVSRHDKEQKDTALKAATADLQKAQEAVKEVQAMLDWTVLRAPMDGTVIDKKVDVGDTVVPGQVLVTLFDPTRMQLVASVRDSLVHRLQVGQDIGVKVDVLKKVCNGQIREIVPESQTSSRSFQVKVTGPCPPGIYSGMFGRVLIPLGEEQVLVIPQQAVRDVGQLELVDVVEGGRLERRAIRIGRTVGTDVEVLSGLREGEKVVVPSAGQEPTHG